MGIPNSLSASAKASKEKQRGNENLTDTGNISMKKPVHAIAVNRLFRRVYILLLMHFFFFFEDFSV